VRSADRGRVLCAGRRLARAERIKARALIRCPIAVFDHVTIRASDRAASEAFYNTVLSALGIDETYQIGTFSEWRDFSLSEAGEDTPTTRGLHIAFVSPNREQVDGFWRAGTEAGYRDDGPPGPRPQYRSDYYGSFLRDPDGNSVEAVHHGNLRRGGVIDHLWIRVADLAAARRFYETIAPSAGIRLSDATPERVEFTGASGSFSLVPGPPTEHLHVAFESKDDDAVRRFHEQATAAGYRSRGAPGERARYHPGYYAAYILDPDGNNVEVGNHHRDG
jgi:catechol 2,3-dioxygenase-like lactoylglutathione lyase family enzyme